jgi:hemerythrin superfamily protein
MPTGIELILADHRYVDELFAEFETLGSAAGPVAGQIFNELTAHDEVEQHALYPLASAVLDDEELMARSLEAHTQAKVLMERARALEGAPLVDVMTQLRDAVQAHVADEESALLPALKKAATPQQLDGLGSRIDAIKQRVG